MKLIRSIIITLLLIGTTLAATAQTERPERTREVAFRITGAVVQQFDPPRESRRGRYAEALVISIEASATEYLELPPAQPPFLYIGTHELRPVDMEYVGDRVLITFHDPLWEKLQGGEPMVMTADHGDPLNDPEKYRGYPGWDPRIIKR